MKKIALSITSLLISLSSFGQNKVTTANINFRSTPEFANNKICVIPKGTELTLISGIMRYGNWIPIEYKEKIGYVHVRYVRYVKRKISKQNKLLSSNH